MDSSLAGLTAQPTPVEVHGRTYQLHKLRFEDFGKFQAWCDTQFADPFAVVARQLGTGRFNKAQEQSLLAEAIKLDSKPKPRLGSPECSELIESFEGFSRIFHLAVSRGDPDFKIEDARAAVGSFNEAHILMVSSALSLDLIKADAKAADGDDDPKASTSGASTMPP